MPSSLHFSDHELACHHCGLNCSTAELCSALEALRAIGCAAKGRDTPLYVLDAYRCKDWNLRVPHAATHSAHVMGVAADVCSPGVSAAELWNWVVRIPIIRGVGRADVQRYVHIDLRVTPARWCYSASGETVSWFDAPVVNA